MPGLLIMLPIAIIIALGFLGLFFWSVKNGDLEDSEMIKYRMIYDDQDDVAREMNKPSRAPEIDAEANS